MKNEVIEKQNARIWLEDESIFHIEILPGADVALEDAQELVGISLKLKKTPSVSIMVDLRGIKSITREARACFAGQEAGNVVDACALLIGSAGSRVIGNFFLGINKPTYPTRLFTSEAKALEWLKGFAARKETLQT